MATGRPRTFDADQALERALHVFWEKGYEGTSLPDLTAAMGINRPSLYAAFGNKESLFRKVVERYAAGPGAYIYEALNEPTARKVVASIFKRAVDLLTDSTKPRGCLMVQGALACGENSRTMRDELTAWRARGEKAIRERFERAKTDADLPADASPADLARFVTTVIQGMAVQAAGGASRRDLGRVVELAMRVWR